MIIIVKKKVFSTVVKKCKIQVIVFMSMLAHSSERIFNPMLCTGYMDVYNYMDIFIYTDVYTIWIYLDKYKYMDIFRYI